jgi:hypothetical protein
MSENLPYCNNYDDEKLEPTMIMKALSDMMMPAVDLRRNVTVHTGPGGADLFEEEMEFRMDGSRRRYIGKKVTRILRRVHKNIRKSHRDLYFFSTKPQLPKMSFSLVIMDMTE